jgi:hypothetical protein
VLDLFVQTLVALRAEAEEPQHILQRIYESRDRPMPYPAEITEALTGAASALPDPVNSPSHYRANGVEVIDVIEAFDLDFRLGNTIKYLLRAGRKGGARQHVEDLEKARWYLEREIERKRVQLAAFEAKRV